MKFLDATRAKLCLLFFFFFFFFFCGESRGHYYLMMIVSELRISVSLFHEKHRKSIHLLNTLCILKLCSLLGRARGPADVTTTWQARPSVFPPSPPYLPPVPRVFLRSNLISFCTKVFFRCWCSIILLPQHDPQGLSGFVFTSYALVWSDPLVFSPLFFR